MAASTKFRILCSAVRPKEQKRGKNKTREWRALVRLSFYSRELFWFVFKPSAAQSDGALSFKQLFAHRFCTPLRKLQKDLLCRKGLYVQILHGAQRRHGDSSSQPSHEKEGVGRIIITNDTPDEQNTMASSPDSTLPFHRDALGPQRPELLSYKYYSVILPRRRPTST